MYLIDTNVISETRKKGKSNSGVKAFFKQADQLESQLFISVITIGELLRGVEIIRHRGDKKQSDQLEKWLTTIVSEYSNNILSFTETEAMVWGALRVPHHENAIDKQIAATALTYGLTVVTRNTNDFLGSGVQVINPFN
jgi:toxin FitB